MRYTLLNLEKQEIITDGKCNHGILIGSTVNRMYAIIPVSALSTGFPQIVI